MKNWKKPACAVIKAEHVNDVIKAYAFTCFNGHLR